MIASGQEEFIELDFKRSPALINSDRNKAEISKDVSAFANTVGGTILYGIEEDPKPPHRAIAIDPIDSSTTSKEWDILDAYGNTLSISGFTWNNGNFSEVNFPGAGFTEVAGINAHGDLVGMWGPDPNLPVGHGFLYSQARGQFTSFDAFPVVSSPHATQADDINGIGNIIGQYWSGNGAHHGFLKVGNDFTHIDYPGAYQTTPWGINSSLQIVGNWYESDGRAHGWLAQPGQQ